MILKYTGNGSVEGPVIYVGESLPYENIMVTSITMNFAGYILCVNEYDIYPDAGVLQIRTVNPMANAIGEQYYIELW